MMMMMTIKRFSDKFRKTQILKGAADPLPRAASLFRATRQLCLSTDVAVFRVVVEASGRGRFNADRV